MKISQLPWGHCDCYNPPPPPTLSILRTIPVQVVEGVSPIPHPLSPVEFQEQKGSSLVKYGYRYSMKSTFSLFLELENFAPPPPPVLRKFLTRHCRKAVSTLLYIVQTMPQLPQQSPSFNLAREGQWVGQQPPCPSSGYATAHRTHHISDSVGMSFLRGRYNVTVDYSITYDITVIISVG